MFRFSSTAIAGVLVAWLIAGRIGEAAPITYTYGFTNITNDDPDDADTGEAQLFVDVSNTYGGFELVGQVAFTFRNVGLLASSITDIYFDDGTLLGISQIFNGPGVSFSQGASPGDLPGGNELIVPFQTTAGFLADSDSPVQPNGVNPGELVTIIFDLINGQGYQSIIDALAQGLADPSVAGSLRIGIHVQGFTGGGSESFVNGPGENVEPGPNGVPEPGSLVLLALGSVGLCGAYRRKMRGAAG